jgi:polar amino acid transport system substrate-binding protein
MGKKRIIAGAALAGALVAAVCAGCTKTDQGAAGITIRPGTLTVGMEIGYPPMEYYDIDGRTPIGFDVQLAKALAAKLGLEFAYEDTAWDGIFAGLETGKYDIIISSVTITEERRQKYIFPQAYIANAQAIVLPTGSTRTIRGLEDLAGMRVAYQAETTSDDIMTDLGATGISFRPFEYDKVMNCFDELRAGRVDVIVCDSVVAYYYRANPAYSVTIVWEGAGEELGICINGGNTRLADAVGAVLDELFADGTVQGISQDVFGTDLVSSVRP